MDLSSASLAGETEITVWGLIGDAKIIVPDGARVSLEGFFGIGDRKEALSQARQGGPVIRVKSFRLLGDTKLYSLSQVPEGRLRKFWRQLRADQNKPPQLPSA